MKRIHILLVFLLSAVITLGFGATSSSPTPTPTTTQTAAPTPTATATQTTTPTASPTATTTIPASPIQGLEGGFHDGTTATENTFASWASTAWTQTSAGEFGAGSLSDIDLASSPGDAVLARNETDPFPYRTPGTLASAVYDSGSDGTRWDGLFWDETTGASTDITFEVRASDTLFLKDDGSPGWTSVGGTTPVTAGLPQGRYLQWRATLSTTDTDQTPVLHEVRTWYYDYP